MNSVPLATPSLCEDRITQHRRGRQNSASRRQRRHVGRREARRSRAEQEPAEPGQSVGLIAAITEKNGARGT